jgi:NAD(P)-dependent dehydrogenase (short-subunit alcohol dehydrogenase family)
MLFTLEAARRWQVDGITVNCLHPGFVATRIGRDGDGGRLGEIATTLLRPFAKTPERGARTSVYLATAPEPAGVTGRYFVNSQQKLPMATALDEAAAARLWRVSSEMVGIGG